MDFSGQTLFITAGANGMGRCFAERAAESGGNIVIADVDGDAAVALAETLPSALGLSCDVRNTGDVERARDAALARFGAIDLVMSHAGITVAGPLAKIDDDAWVRIFDVNVFGMVRVLRAFIPHLVSRGRGHVVLTSSSLALIGGHPLSGMAAPYVSSKTAVIGLAQSAAIALAPHGISVTLFAPDLTETGFAKPPADQPPIANPAKAALMSHPRQTPEQAISVLNDALERGAFLASATPDFRSLLQRQAEVLLDPLALAELYKVANTPAMATND